ncbi:MAG: FecR domain-containing protein, partial [Ardenticatenaceae bacterium]|nr:FecR domain-containing protein [Ardenticatenaceae bacterium]
QASLGPNSEISLDTVDAQRAGTGFRTVVLTLAYGDSEHQVQFRHDSGSRYEVQTASGSGIARGTRFRVTASNDGAATYAVQEGRVDVTNANRTVQVTAMQQTTFTNSEPPEDPTFLVTGEGIVTEIGEIWVIAGQSFAVTDTTVIEGDPQVGDIVRVEAHLQDDGPPLADYITLLQPAPDNRFHLTGIVDSIGGDAWVIAGQTIAISTTTDIDEDIVVGDRVYVAGVILPGGELQAETIERLGDDEPYPFAFTGVVQAIGDDTWMISGNEITITETTGIEPGIVVGDLVHVTGFILDDDTWLADEITLVTAVDATFTISGILESMDPWVVAGLPFEVESWTVIDPEMAVGDLVRVNGRIRSDGTWVATEIERLDDDTLLQIIFVGTVDGMAPWVVSGLPLVTDEESLIDDDIAVGDLVRVTAVIRNDGTWLATRIEQLDTVIEPGCVAITAVITGINGDQIILSNGQTYILGEDIVIDGEIQVGSVVLIIACANDDGTITIISITVIYTPPVEPPLPPGPPPEDDDDDNGTVYVTICHKPGTPAEKTMTLPQSALDGHLGHGDTLGPCP